MHTLRCLCLCLPSPITNNLGKTLLPTSMVPLPATRRSLRSRCAPPDQGGDPVDLLSKKVDELLRKEENRHLLQGLENAALRVDAARRALADIERQEQEVVQAKATLLELQRREAEIAESQKEILKAKAMAKETERSLSSSLRENIFEDAIGGQTTDLYLERLESVKAALVSSIVGVVACLPISLYRASSSPQLLQHLAVVFLSSAVYGATYRYTIRRDLDNVQLKIGTSAAFGLVQGLASLEAAKPLSNIDTDNLISLAFDGAVFVSTSVFLFLFSAVALDFCFKSMLLSPFPTRK